MVWRFFKLEGRACCRRRVVWRFVEASTKIRTTWPPNGKLTSPGAGDDTANTGDEASTGGEASKLDGGGGQQQHVLGRTPHESALHDHHPTPMASSPALVQASTTTTTRPATAARRASLTAAVVSSSIDSGVVVTNLRCTIITPMASSPALVQAEHRRRGQHRRRGEQA